MHLGCIKIKQILTTIHSNNHTPKFGTWPYNNTNHSSWKVYVYISLGLEELTRIWLLRSFIHINLAWISSIQGVLNSHTMLLLMLLLVPFGNHHRNFEPVLSLNHLKFPNESMNIMISRLHIRPFLRNGIFRSAWCVSKQNLSKYHWQKLQFIWWFWILKRWIWLPNRICFDFCFLNI